MVILLVWRFALMRKRLAMTSTSFAICTWGDRAYEPPKLRSHGPLSTERVETVSRKSVKNITKIPVRAAGTRFTSKPPTKRSQITARNQATALSATLRRTGRSQVWTGDYGLLGEIDEAGPHLTRERHFGPAPRFQLALGALLLRSFHFADEGSR